MRFVGFYKLIVSKLHYLILMAVLLLCFCVIPLTALSATASSDAARWTNINIPGQGTSGDWVLANGADIRCLTVAPDGTMYAYCQGLNYKLYKSHDGGGDNDTRDADV